MLGYLNNCHIWVNCNLLFTYFIINIYLCGNFFKMMIIRYSITAKIDDDMVAYYCNEDLFLLELKAVDEDLYDVTFVELMDH